MTANTSAYPVWPGWDTCRLIGEGSFGRVYEIHKTDFPSVRSAMKVITIPQNQSEVRALMYEGMDQKKATNYFYSFVQEIVKEFELLSQLRGHSNIVSYEDSMVISHDDAIGWDVSIRMELLSPMLDAPGVKEDWRRVAKVGLDMCRALELCRRNNIIHRDIKPENIFVSANDDFKLGDFGIARTVEKTTNGMSRKGTYSYMAPEVYKGEAYGPSVDQYSLGLVLYWLLNDRRTPFLPPAPIDITYNDKERALALRMSGERIPEPKNGSPLMKAAVLRACSYDPKDRFPSPSDFGRALRDALLSEDRTVVLLDNDSPPKPKYTPPSPPEVSREAVPFVRTYNTSLHTADPPPIRKERLYKEQKGSQSQPVNKSSKRHQTGTSTAKGKKGWILVAVIAILAVVSVVLALIIVRDARARSGALWTGINRETISAGGLHTVCLKTDGTVVAVGRNHYGQCEVAGWSDIVAVCAGHQHTVGLKTDGTVVAAGYGYEGQCKVSDWSGIVDISAEIYQTIGLKTDGTVVATGYSEWGQCDVSDWSNIIAVSAGVRHTVGLELDGTVVATGDNNHGQCDVSGWKDIVAISAGENHTVGLCADVTAVATGDNDHGQCEVSGWRDIVAISAGWNHTVGLRADGTVVATGRNDYGQCEVSGWSDIVAVSAGNQHTVGLKTDGTVVAVGNNEDERCEVSVWRDIRLP